MPTVLWWSSRSAALILVLASFLSALGVSRAFHLLPSVAPSGRIVLNNRAGLSQPLARVAYRSGVARMQQDNLDAFDEDLQYSMDSLTFSGDTEPAQMEFSVPAPPVSKTGMSASTQLKLNVLMACTGLDRGSAADSEQRSEVEFAVKALEAQPSASDFPEGFNGRWRLVYTSALSPGSESGGGAGANSLPFFQTPAPAARFSFGGRGQIGQVYQNVDVSKGRLDNVVEVNPPGPMPLGKTTLTLEHKLEFTPGTPKRSKITLINVAVDGPLKQLGIQPLKLPVIEAISSQGAGVFDTTFCDEDMRVARGDRGELRVFVKR